MNEWYTDCPYESELQDRWTGLAVGLAVSHFARLTVRRASERRWKTALMTSKCAPEVLLWTKRYRSHLWSSSVRLLMAGAVRGAESSELEPVEWRKLVIPDIIHQFEITFDWISFLPGQWAPFEINSSVSGCIVLTWTASLRPLICNQQQWKCYYMLMLPLLQALRFCTR